MRGNPTLLGAAKMIPTPTASMATIEDLEQARFAGNDPRRPDYAAARLIPTPCAQDAKNSTLPPSQRRRDTVPGAVIREMFYTPTSVSGHQTGRIDEWGGSHNPYRGEKGQCRPRYLNPEFVEWLMGFPIGWTVCGPLATRSYRSRSILSSGRLLRLRGLARHRRRMQRLVKEF